MTKQNDLLDPDCGDQGLCLMMVAGEGDVVYIYDSKVKGGPRLAFSRAEIAALLDGAKRGEFDDLA